MVCMKRAVVVCVLLSSLCAPVEMSAATGAPVRYISNARKAALIAAAGLVADALLRRGDSVAAAVPRNGKAFITWLWNGSSEGRVHDMRVFGSRHALKAIVLLVASCILSQFSTHIEWWGSAQMPGLSGFYKPGEAVARGTALQFFQMGLANEQLFGGVSVDLDAYPLYNEFNRQYRLALQAPNTTRILHAMDRYLEGNSACTVDENSSALVEVAGGLNRIIAALATSGGERAADGFASILPYIRQEDGTRILRAQRKKLVVKAVQALCAIPHHEVLLDTGAQFDGPMLRVSLPMNSRLLIFFAV